jgi:hypothetical protein
MPGAHDRGPTARRPAASHGLALHIADNATDPHQTFGRARGVPCRKRGTRKPVAYWLPRHHIGHCFGLIVALLLTTTVLTRFQKKI